MKYEDLKCKRCDGTGLTGITVHTDNGDYDADDQPCPDCESTGINENLINDIDFLLAYLEDFAHGDESVKIYQMRKRLE